MNFLISILGGLFGILLAFIVIILIIYIKIRSMFSSSQRQELKNAIVHAKDIEKEQYSKEKHVVGLSKLLEPRIIHDFPEFNKDLLFSLNEKNLRKIFNCIENQDISEINDDPDLIYMMPQVKAKIEDMRSNQIHEKFDNIVFNRSAISSYTKEDGKATIKVSTSIGYYYKTNKKSTKSFNDIMKQTRYTSEFVYVYDEAKIGVRQIAISIHCKNCGAPITNLRNSFCEYCMTPVQRINLRAWKMSSYKEDYN